MDKSRKMQLIFTLYTPTHALPLRNVSKLRRYKSNVAGELSIIILRCAKKKTAAVSENLYEFL
jgi:hypothetical protein